MSAAKFKLITDPIKTSKAWLCNIEGVGSNWIPFTFIKAWSPATKEIKIDTFILRQKGIKYKL